MTSPRSDTPRRGLPPEPGMQSWRDAASIPRSPSTPEYPAAHAPLDHARPETGRRRVGGWAVFGRLCALIYVLLIAVAVLLPDPAVIHAMKLNIAHVIRQVAIHIADMHGVILGDIASNIAAFIPLTLLLALAWRRVPLWACGVTGTLTSIMAEALQYFLPQIHRRPDIWNVVQNSIGAWIGVAIAAVIFQLFGQPDADNR